MFLVVGQSESSRNRVSQIFKYLFTLGLKFILRARRQASALFAPFFSCCVVVVVVVVVVVCFF